MNMSDTASAQHHPEYNSFHLDQPHPNNDPNITLSASYFPYSKHLLPSDARNPNIIAIKHQKMEQLSGSYWDKFYNRNGGKFFKDRHWLLREFPELETGKGLVIGAGCGCGNTIFPLLEANSQFTSAGFDFSRNAVQIAAKRAKDMNWEHRTNFFEFDLTNTTERNDEVSTLQNLSPFQKLKSQGDFVALIFVLSAISPQKMKQAVKNVEYITKPGGIVFLRDYALNDLAQTRFKNQDDKHVQIEENFFARGDGTRAYYFKLEEMRQLFSKWECLENRLVEKQVVNAKEGSTMRRRFIQSKFRLPLEASEDVSSRT